MSERDVIEAIVETFQQFKSQTVKPFWCALLLCVSTTHDDPVAAGNLAQLAIEKIKAGDPICGVGFYGHEV
jgi:hypothetical protein